MHKHHTPHTVCIVCRWFLSAFFPCVLCCTLHPHGIRIPACMGDSMHAVRDWDWIPIGLDLFSPIPAFFPPKRGLSTFYFLAFHITTEVLHTYIPISINSGYYHVIVKYSIVFSLYVCPLILLVEADVGFKREDQHVDSPCSRSALTVSYGSAGSAGNTRPS